MVQLTDNQYAELLGLASAGAVITYEQLAFEKLKKAIDSTNGIVRYVLMVRYQEVPQQPAVIGATADYPQGTTKRIEQLRPITRQDVDDLLKDVATIPSLVLVTPDSNAIVGWAALDDYTF